MKHVLLPVSAALLLTACVTTSGSLSDASARLERSADTLSEELRRGSGDDSLRRDAEEFAEVAEEFNDEVGDGAEREDLQRRFERVAQQYHELREEFDDETPSGSDERDAFQDLTSAYLDLERELQYKRVSGL